MAARSSWLVSRPIAATAPNTWRALVVQIGDLRGDQIGQHHRDRLACQVRGDEFPGEERVSLTPRDHLVDERVRCRLPDQRRNPGGDLVAIEPFQVDPMCCREPGQLGQSAPL